MLKDINYVLKQFPIHITIISKRPQCSLQHCLEFKTKHAHNIKACYWNIHELIFLDSPIFTLSYH